MHLSVQYTLERDNKVTPLFRKFLESKNLVLVISAINLQENSLHFASFWKSDCYKWGLVAEIGHFSFWSLNLGFWNHSRVPISKLSSIFDAGGHTLPRPPPPTTVYLAGILPCK